VTGLPGTDTGPDIEDDPAGCYQARTDGYTPTCGRSDGDHCPACELCPGHHATDCGIPVALAVLNTAGITTAAQFDQLTKEVARA